MTEARTLAEIDVAQRMGIDVFVIDCDAAGHEHGQQ
jgi:hypothetical protein